jgi:hypothetical protein
MRYSIVNAGSKTATEILKAYWTKYPGNCQTLNLLDYFAKYSSYRNVFNAIDSNILPKNTNIEKIDNKFFLEQILKETDVLVYFTHAYYENVTCKNQLMASVAQAVKHVPSVKKAIFVNLLEFNQTNEPEYFNKSLEVEKQIVEELPQAQVLRTDLTYNDKTSLISFLKYTRNLAIGQNGHASARWTDVEKVADCLNLMLTDKLTSKLNYATHTDEVSFAELFKKLNIADGNTFNINYANDNLVTDLLSDAEYRNYTRLVGSNHRLDKLFADYKPVSTENKYSAVLDSVKL